MRITRPIAVLLCGLVTLTLSPTVGASGQPYPRSSVRLQVKPTQTEVYVDGAYTGLVDNYDGLFQRLHLPPGEHEIELYLEGYESIRERLYLVEGETYKIQHEMLRLAAGVPRPPRPEPVLPPATDAYSAEPLGPAVERPLPADRFGTLAIRVQPLDAEVMIDGERWQGFAGVYRLVVELGAGVHQVEVRREGHRTYRTEVEVRERETTLLNVSLPQTGSVDQ